MENATKALYMAVGVFIGVLILTAMIFVFRQGGQMLETLDNNNETLAIEKFNSELIIYNRPGTEESYNTIFDIVTACNLAYNINRENEYDSDNCVIIELNSSEGHFILLVDETQEKGYIGTKKLTELIQKLGQKDIATNQYEHRFSGTIDQYNNGKINKIIFTEV